MLSSSSVYKTETCRGCRGPHSSLTTFIESFHSPTCRPPFYQAIFASRDQQTAATTSQDVSVVHLNPSPTGQTVTTVGQPIVPVPAPAHPPEQAAAGPASSHNSSVPELLLDGHLNSCACSPSLSDIKDLIPTVIHDSSVGLLPYPLSYTSPTPHSSTSPETPSIASSVSSNSNHPNIDHVSSNGFTTCSAMNWRWRESTSLCDRRPIRPPPLCSSVIPPRAFNSPPKSPVVSLQSQEIDVTPSPPTVIRQPIPQHPKMVLSYILNPSSPVGGGEETRPDLVARKPFEIPSSRSPSPTLSAFTSDTQHNPHDQSPIPSPATTPPSSPPPIPPPMADLPNMVEPPQLLPWEVPPLVWTHGTIGHTSEQEFIGC